MLSTKPYLVRAFYEWIVDSQGTPFIVINTNIPRCNVPQEFIENGEIIFNISPEAIRDLKIGNELLEFHASFSGVVRIVSVPIKAILAIYAEENGQGMFFDENESESGAWSEEGASPVKPEPFSNSNDKKKTSHLRLVE